MLIKYMQDKEVSCAWYNRARCLDLVRKIRREMNVCCSRTAKRFFNYILGSFHLEIINCLATSAEAKELRMGDRKANYPRVQFPILPMWQGKYQMMNKRNKHLLKY